MARASTGASDGPGSRKSFSRTGARATPSRRGSILSRRAEQAVASPKPSAEALPWPWRRRSQIFESGTEGDYDRILAVVARDPERLRRWEAKGGDAEDAGSAWRRSIPADAARARAHDVLVNDGTLEDLRRRV